MCIRYLNLPPPISLENLPHFWEQNDILILLIDLDSYNALNTEYLDDTEKEYLARFKTSYFKKRYSVSRIVLKYVLSCLLKEQSIYYFHIYKDEYGKVHVLGHKELHICISYTGNIVSLAISKVEIGIDIELRKSLSPGKVSRYLHKPVLKIEDFGNGPDLNDLDLLMVWSLKEAYCKFSNKSMSSSLNKELDLRSVFYSSYILNDKYILSIITSVNPHALNISYLPKIVFSESSEN
jgi:4'-phosphopantetheinyl transferase